MPSHSEEQAKTMSAIAHGWKPKGSAAGIPVKVAKEFHAADAGHKYGKGHDKHKTDGGAALKIAYEQRRRARAEGGEVFEGPIISAVPGRTDKHPIDVGSGSYVIPSESVSSLGENNTLAGLDKLKKMGAPGLRKLVHSAPGAEHIKRKHMAKGGAAISEGDSSLGKPIPIIAAGGEHVLTPEEVSHIGDGDVGLGHRLLDNWVVQNRKKHIDVLKSLKPPAKD